MKIQHRSLALSNDKEDTSRLISGLFDKFYRKDYEIAAMISLSSQRNIKSLHRLSVSNRQTLFNTYTIIHQSKNIIKHMNDTILKAIYVYNMYMAV